MFAALADVPTLQRDAFLLHVEGGLSLDEIASLTAASAETVKSRLRYAYRRLRATLEDLNEQSRPRRSAVTRRQDAALERAWQQASDEQPPPELDAAIIAAARKSVQDRVAEDERSPTSPRSRDR